MNTKQKTNLINFIDEQINALSLTEGSGGNLITALLTNFKAIINSMDSSTSLQETINNKIYNNDLLGLLEECYRTVISFYGNISAKNHNNALPINPEFVQNMNVLSKALENSDIKNALFESSELFKMIKQKMPTGRLTPDFFITKLLTETFDKTQKTLSNFSSQYKKLQEQLVKETKSDFMQPKTVQEAKEQIDAIFNLPMFKAKLDDISYPVKFTSEQLRHWFNYNLLDSPLAPDKKLEVLNYITEKAQGSSNKEGLINEINNLAKTLITDLQELASIYLEKTSRDSAKLSAIKELYTQLGEISTNEKYIDRPIAKIRYALTDIMIAAAKINKISFEKGIGIGDAGQLMADMLDKTLHTMNQVHAGHDLELWNMIEKEIEYTNKEESKKQVSSNPSLPMLEQQQNQQQNQTKEIEVTTPEN